MCSAPPHFSPVNQQKDCKPPSRAAPLLSEHSQISPTGNTPSLFKQVSGFWETSLWQALGLPQSRRLQEFQSSHPSRNCLPKRHLPRIPLLCGQQPSFLQTLLPSFPCSSNPILAVALSATHISTLSNSGRTNICLFLLSSNFSHCTSQRDGALWLLPASHSQ